MDILEGKDFAIEATIYKLAKARGLTPKLPPALKEKITLHNGKNKKGIKRSTAETSHTTKKLYRNKVRRLV